MKGGTGSGANTRGAVKVNYCSYGLNVSDNIMSDIASGIGVRLFNCRGGVVADNTYIDGQVVRIPSAENNFDISISGNKGATIVVDGDNNTILQNDAVVTGYPATSTTPRVVGQHTFESGEAFIATGIASSSDWQQITP